MNPLEELTVIIPTQSRHSHLTRILDYYADCPFRIIIVDSGAKAFELEEDKSNVEYYHVPNTTLHRKIHDALTKVTTSYTLLCADDDFIIPNALKTCIGFLDKNPSYASVKGNYVWFYNRWMPKYYPLTLETYGLDFKQDKPSERIKQLGKTYTFLHYSVHRTESLKKVYTIFSDLPDTLLRCSQSFLDIICIANGKHKVLPIFYCAMEMSIGQATNALPSFEDIYKDEELKKQIDDCLYQLPEYLTQKEDMEIIEAQKLIWQPFFFSKYISTFGDAQMVKQYTSSITDKPTLANWIKSFTNSLAYKFITFKSHYLNPITKRAALIRKAKSYQGFPFSEKESTMEWERIRKTIKKHWFTIFVS